MFGPTEQNLSLCNVLQRPNELTGAIIYLASENASYTTGADIVVDGAFIL